MRESIVGKSTKEHLCLVGTDQIDEQLVFFADKLPLEPSDLSDKLVHHHLLFNCTYCILH
jgi:hypothetical protein